MREPFEPRDMQHHLRNKNTLYIPKIMTSSHGLETVQYMGQTLANANFQCQRVPVNNGI